MKSIVLGRHIAGIVIVALAYPFMMYGSFDVISWLAAALLPLLASGVVTGLLSLFFTSSQARRSRENFLLLSWVMIGLAMLGTPRGENLLALLVGTSKTASSVEERNPWAPRAEGTSVDAHRYFDDTQKCDPDNAFMRAVPACRDYEPQRK